MCLNSCCTCYIKTCWSPCFWHSTVRAGSFAVAVYTMALSLCIITYLINIINGGDSSQFYLPLFEADLHSSTQHAANFCIIMFTLLIVWSGMLMWGIKHDVRGLMLPWLVHVTVLLTGQLMFGLWLIFGYYIYLEGVFASLVNLAWWAYNVYCWWVVRNHYRNVKWFQSPDIEVLEEYAR